jgi:SAM-dependent methyltransferase
MDKSRHWCSPRLLRLLALGLGLSVLWPRLRGAPWLPMRMRTVHKLLALCEVGPGDVVYDLGCGDGRLIIAAARRYGARAVGIEIHPLRVLWCRALIALLGLSDRVQVVWGDFFNQDLSGASVVICYLLQRTNEKLEGKLRQELAPGTRVVSKRFTFRGLRLVRRDDTDRLYLYEPDS